jgi:bifunctional DNase/RNase
MHPSRPVARRGRALLAGLVLVVVALGGWLVWESASYSMPLLAQEAANETLSPTAHEMVVANLVRERRGAGVLLVLQERGRGRYLVLTIGTNEAVAIARPMQGEVSPRPMTHDLLARVLEELHAEVVRVVVTDLQENTFYAQLVLRVDGREVAIDARPSDAIAIAVRVQAPIYVEADVLERASLSTEEAF